MNVRFSWHRSVRSSIIFLTIFGLFFSSAPTAFAGFGITPPYVENNRLTRGTVFEQKITLVRSDPTEALRAQITMNIPEVESWFSIDQGNEFILPEGQTQVPIIVRVAVPDDAQYKQYGGTIRIRTSPVEQNNTGGVSIALGAQIDVNIEVVDKILDFNIRKIRITDLEEGRRKWGLSFPGKIRFFMTVENTGNVAYGPTRVQFDIYDANLETLLETTYNTNKIDRVEPFAIDEVFAELPTRLSPGRYKAKYTIYSGDAVAQQNEINVSISAAGAVLGYTGYGFEGLSLADKAKVGAVILVPILVIIGLIFFVISVRRSQKRRFAEYAEAPPREEHPHGGGGPTMGQF